MMFHTVYLSFEETPNGRGYIGKHSSVDPYDSYYGSYKDTSFNPSGKIILEYAKTEEGALQAEVRWQKIFEVAEKPEFANRSYQTSSKFNYDLTGFKFSEESRGRMRKSHTGVKDTEETKRKKSAAQKAAQNRPEVKQKQSKSRKGKPKSPDHILKIKEAHNTPEALQRKREAMVGRDTGKKRTEGTKLKMSEKKKGKKVFTNREGKRLYLDPGTSPPEGWNPGYTKPE
jgi:hypothetical protein